MNTPQTNTSPRTAAAGLNTPSLVVGGLGLMAIGALAAVLFMGKGSPTAEAPPAPSATAATSAAPPATVASAAVVAAEPAPVAKPLSPEPVAAPVAKSPAPKSAAAPAAALPAATTPAPSSEPAPIVRAEAPPAPVQAAKQVCATCGVVIAVTPVQRKGEAGALGTVAGAVVGGALGHQTGGGSGKTAMTVLGAVGGAMAGREIEKHQRSTTIYDVRIRMDDGSTSTFTVERAFDVGQKVRVEGEQLLPRSTPQSSGR